MKKIIALLVLLCVIIAAGTVFAQDNTEPAPLPRVDLVSAEEPGILGLTTKSTKLKSYLTYKSDDLSFVWPVTVKLQGTSTLAFDKKNFTIVFYTDDTYQKKQKVTVLDEWGAHNKYCLKANYQDSTQARNVVAAEIAGAMNKPYGIFPDAPNNGLIDGYPIEVYVDNEYRGIYTWNIPKDDWMFAMDSKNENNIVMQADNVLSDAILFMSESAGVADADWNIEVGPEDDPEAVSAAFEKLNRAIRFVINSSDEEFKENFSEYFDLDATLNYYCFVAYTNTTDNMAKNMLLATLDGEIWYPSLYDLDTAFGLYFGGDGIYDPHNRVVDFQGGTSLFWKRVVENFPQELAERYWTLRGTVLNIDYIMGKFYAFNALIPQAAWQREREKWPDVPSIPYGLESIREHLLAREPYIDGVFAEMEPDDPRVIYKLQAPYQGSAGTFVDTGMNLYAEDADFTIFLKLDAGQAGDKTTVILSNSNAQRHGLMVETASDGTNSYTRFYVGAYTYEALYGLESDGYAYIVIRKNGDEYTFYARGTSDQRQVVSALPTEVKSNLVLGGFYYVDDKGVSHISDMYTGGIEKCVIYNEALDPEEINSVWARMKVK